MSPVEAAHRSAVRALLGMAAIGYPNVGVSVPYHSLLARTR